MHRLNIFFKISLVVSLFSSLEATTLQEDSREVTQSSAWIGQVRIISHQVLPTRLPVTEYRVRVLDVIKGEGKIGDEFHFVLPGGSRGGKTFSIMGLSAASFQNDQEYIVFLDEPPSIGASTAYAAVRPQVGLRSWTAYQVLKPVSGESNNNRIVRRAGSLGSVSRGPSGLALRHMDAQMFRLEDLLTQINRDLD